MTTERTRIVGYNSGLRALLKNLLRRLGYVVYRFPTTFGMATSHDIILPMATYSPWNSDRDFQKVFRVVQPYTLVDVYRCFELWVLVEQSKKLSGALIEVGAWRGGTGAIIAQKAQLCEIADPVYLCDTFAGVVKSTHRDTQYKGGEHADASYEIVEELMHGVLGLQNVRILKGLFPEETLGCVQEERFRFCHIDVDTYQSAKDILAVIWERMVVGGIVVFDDYGRVGCEGITGLVEEQRGLQDCLLFHNLNGHAIMVKVK